MKRPATRTCKHCGSTVVAGIRGVDRWFEKFLGRKEGRDLSPAKRKCNWCGRGDEWSSRWEYVNNRRWYHESCIALMDAIS